MWVLQPNLVFITWKCRWIAIIYLSECKHWQWAGLTTEMLSYLVHPKKCIKQLRLLQELCSSAVLTRNIKREYITAVLQPLHRLPFTFRIDFNSLFLFLKALHGLSPAHTSDMLTVYEPVRPPRGVWNLSVMCRTKSFGDAASQHLRFAGTDCRRIWEQLEELTSLKVNNLVCA